MTEARAIVLERTEEAKRKRRMYGDIGAKYSQDKVMRIGGDIIGCITTMAIKDNIIAEIYED